MVATILALAHQLDMRVVAEGVETKEQLEQLECGRAQGYHICRPLPPGEIEPTLLRSTPLMPTRA